MERFVVLMVLFAIFVQIKADASSTIVDYDAECDTKPQRTLVVIKPSGHKSKKIGAIIQRFEDKGYDLIAMKMVMATEELMKKHYEKYADEEFFPQIYEYMSSGPCVAMVWEGHDAINEIRLLLGVTDPPTPGTIRFDFSTQSRKHCPNVCHASDSVESAELEIALWFAQEELIN